VLLFLLFAMREFVDVMVNGVKSLLRIYQNSLYTDKWK